MKSGAGSSSGAMLRTETCCCSLPVWPEASIKRCGRFVSRFRKPRRSFHTAFRINLNQSQNVGIENTLQALDCFTLLRIPNGFVNTGKFVR